MALVFPGGPAGVFDVTQPTAHWNCAGDEITDDIPALDVRLLVRLNCTAVGEALFIAASHADKDIVWQWCVVTKKGMQHVYHATAAQASNGSGGARIDGVRSVAQWLGSVCRTPHARAPVPPQPPLPAAPSHVTFDSLARDIWDNCLTQRDSSGVELGPTRDVVLGELEKVHYLCDALRPRSPTKRSRE